MYTLGDYLVIVFTLSMFAVLFCGAALYRCLCIEKRLNIMEEAFNARLGRHEERLKTEPVGKIFSNGTTLWEDIQNLFHPEDNWGNWR